MMKTNKMMSPAEMLKNEIMERYGLREDQVRLELSISTADLDLGRQILADFNTKYPESNKYLPENEACDSVSGKIINHVVVHRKDGYYGTYVAGEDNE